MHGMNVKIVIIIIYILIMYIRCTVRMWKLLWKLLSRTVTFAVHTARVPAPHNHSQQNQCKTPYASVCTLVLLMIGIMTPETCWDKSLIMNIRLLASCWFLSLHPTFMMHGHKPKTTKTTAWTSINKWKCATCCLCIEVAHCSTWLE